MSGNALATLATVATEPRHRSPREPQPALVLRSASPSKPSNSSIKQVVRATAVDSSTYHEPPRPALVPVSAVAQPALVPMEPHVGKVRTASMMQQSHQPMMHHPAQLVQVPRQMIHTKYQKTQNSFDRRSPGNEVQVQVQTMPQPVQSRRSFTSSPIHPSTQAHVISHSPMAPPMNHSMQPVYYSSVPMSYVPPQPTMMMTPNGPMMMVPAGPQVQQMNPMMQPTMIQVPVQQPPPAPYGYQYVSHVSGPPPGPPMMQPPPMQQVQYVQAGPAGPPHMGPPPGMAQMVSVPIHYQPHPQQYLVQ